MAAPIKTLCCSVLRCSRRSFGTTSTNQAGKKWRTEHGLAPSGTEYGPLTDLPDWSYADVYTPEGAKVQLSTCFYDTPA
ncbi:unnamed protein product [Boreogadus saida]